MDFGRQVRIMLNSVRYLLALCVNVLLAILLIYGVGQLCIASYHFCYRTVGNVVVEKAPGTDHVFLVETDSTMYDVATQLENQGLIVDRYSFYARTKLMEPEEVVLRPGSYVLNTNMTYEEIIDLLTISV